VVNATSAGLDQYTLTGTMSGQTISGSIAGKEVHFETHGFFGLWCFQGYRDRSHDHERHHRANSDRGGLQLVAEQELIGGRSHRAVVVDAA